MNTKQKKKKGKDNLSSNNQMAGIRRGCRIIIIRNGEFVRPIPQKSSGESEK